MSTHIPETDDPYAVDGGPFESDYADHEAYEHYRAVSWSAVSALTLSIFSLLAFIFVTPLVLALAAVILGLYASWVVNRYRDELTGGLMAKLAIALGGFSLVVFGGLHWYTYLTEVPDGYSRISFRDLQPDDPRSLLPASALALDGQQVFVKGYVLPSDRGRHIKKFILVPDLGTCCFGGDPKITDMIEVTLLDHPGLSFSFRRQGLAGTFHVESRPTAAADGQGVIYRLDAEHVR